MHHTMTFLRGQFNGAHQFLEATVQGITPQQAHWSPPGKTVPLGAHYAHVVTTEDALVLGMIAQQAPLLADNWAGKTGLSEMPPQVPPWDEWARRVRLDLPALHVYAQAVYAAVDSYLAPLPDEALDEPFDLSFLGMGMQTVGVFLQVILMNASWHCGEISCIKGLQGLQGYPV